MTHSRNDFGSGFPFPSWCVNSCAMIPIHLFAFAHLAFCAAAILALPSALIFLRGLAEVLVTVDPDGRPRFAGEVVLPVKSALAFSSRAISASIVAKIPMCSWWDYVRGRFTISVERTHQWMSQTRERWSRETRSNSWMLTHRTEIWPSRSCVWWRLHHPVNHQRRGRTEPEKVVPKPDERIAALTNGTGII